MSSYFDGMLRSFEFSGRSTRMQYWMFFLIQVLMIAAGVAIDFRLGGFVTEQINHMPVTLFMVFIHLAPSVTVQVRRLHDIDKSGAWYLLNFVPFGGLVLLYWACRASQQYSSTYDDRPVSGNHEQNGSSIPRGVWVGNQLLAGSRSSASAEGRFI